LDRLLSLELHNMLQNVPLSTFDESLLKDRITEEIPTIAKECGISHLLVRSTVPARSFKDVAHTSESILFSDGSEIDELLEHRIDHGDGGFTLFLYQYSDKPEDISVAEDNLRDLFSVIYILIGRARSMSFMTHALYTDGMTGISNETGIHKFIGEAHRAGRFTQYNAYFINIKDMQMINEQYGSRMGDEVIKAYALKLREIAGKDAIAGRLGGDNFFIFSHRSNHNDIVYKLEAIKLSVPNPNGKDLDVTMECRTGYSEMTEETEVSEAMTEAAVAKMFAGKNGKPNILRFSNDLINLIRQKRMRF